MTELEKLKQEAEAPQWMGEEGYSTISRGYLLPGETPRGMYERVAKAAASYYGSDQMYWEEKFFNVMWRNWLCPASPVLSNMGTDRGLPISCNSNHIPDSVEGIFEKVTELVMLSKFGAGVGNYFGDVRARNTDIRGNGKSEGVIPWVKIYDQTISSVSQGSTRRGAAAAYLPIEHGDADEFVDIRRPTGDVNRRCMNIHHAFTVGNDWMEEMLAGDKEKRRLWERTLTARVETGEPYLFFRDNVNSANPETYVANGLTVKTSNICTEITLYTDPDHTFVCCLSSLNLMRFDEWPDDLARTATYFLDAVLEEYIQKTEDIAALQASRRSAIKGRAIGIGVLGWHSLLQSRMLPFDSFGSMMLNSQVFRTIREGAEMATKELAELKGEPEWCRGFGRRNTHLLAVAPTVSNSIISGGHSAGIEPITANVYAQKSSKGTFIRQNPALTEVLQEMGKDTLEVWRSINGAQGSVQHLDFLPEDVKQVFLTAREINQHAIVKQAIQRQKWVDQAQSVNLFFASNSDPKYIHEVHIEAWRGGLKTLYYCRSEGVLRGDLASRSAEECAACEA